MSRRWAWRGIALSLLVLALVWDLRRPPTEQWTSSLLITGIHLYQRTLSPYMETAGVRCRFEPSCSRYASAVIRQRGALRGSWQAARRVMRCGPWTAPGTQDPAD